MENRLKLPPFSFFDNYFKKILSLIPFNQLKKPWKTLRLVVGTAKYVFLETNQDLVLLDKLGKSLVCR
jgi:hypothetical protein